jgi:histidine kinase/DNA gyrase B/HSP90-like ATPase
MPSRQIPPSAAALIESLRGTGYLLETALADLIDNSIAAEATHVDLTLEWNDGSPFVLVMDDGKGMTEDGLVAAMRFGGAGPLSARAHSDLGRFGLGLKTASLSQCRRLTVASRREGSSCAFCWDLDHIRSVGDAWELLEGVPPGLESKASRMHDRACGTIVIWDRIDFGRRRERPTDKAFLAQIERTERHLAMVFHRYLDGDGRRIRITINGRRLRAWDPFLERHEATIPRPDQSLDSGGERISVRGFVLPHPDRFANATLMEDAAGPGGWAAQQGFYVYRQKRLLSAGGWLGLGGTRAWTREEFSRLARIRIDLPNTIDEDWRIDIRKAQARPPEALRPSLARIADDVRRVAREVFFHRGRRPEGPRRDAIARLWEVHPPTAAKRYTVRRDHPLLVTIRERLGHHDGLLEVLLDLTERTVPVDRIWVDAVENGPPASTVAPPAEYAALIESARSVVRTMVAAGFEQPAAVRAVSSMEPFDTIPDIAARLSEA